MTAEILFNFYNYIKNEMVTLQVQPVSYKKVFSVKQLFSTFSVHSPSITEYRFGRPANDVNHLYETRVSLLQSKKSADFRKCLNNLILYTYVIDLAIFKYNKVLPVFLL